LNFDFHDNPLGFSKPSFGLLSFRRNAHAAAAASTMMKIGVQRFTVAMLKHCTPVHFRGNLCGRSLLQFKMNVENEKASFLVARYISKKKSTTPLLPL